MKMNDSREISAPRAEVWDGLLSAEVLKSCIPGCQEMTGSADSGFETTVVQKIGPIKATFRGEVYISDIVVGQSLRLAGQGKGGAAGFAKGGAKLSLTDSAGGTTLVYEVDASVGGKLARLGSRVVDGFAKKMADEFFAQFQGVLEDIDPLSEADENAQAQSIEHAEGETSGAEKKKGWFKKLF